MSSDYIQPKFDGRINLVQIFANSINPSDVAQITTTINVNGIIITGTMTGMKLYSEGIADNLKETIRSTSEEIDTAIKNYLKSIFEKLKQPPPLEELQKGHDFEYIYLKGAKFYVGQT
jgi:hypothetical protein